MRTANEVLSIAMTTSLPSATRPAPAAKPELDLLILNEVQLLLSEKRTALSGMRTGIAVFALPLSVLSVLIATSRLYDLAKVLHWLIPLLLINGGLVVLGCYLVMHSILRIRYFDRLIQKLKKQHSALAPLM